MSNGPISVPDDPADFAVEDPVRGTGRRVVRQRGGEHRFELGFLRSASHRFARAIRAIRTEKMAKPDLDRSLVRWTRIVGLFTFFLAIVAAIQFWAFVQSERAFLSVISLSVNGNFPIAGDPSVRVFFQVKNGGRNVAMPQYTTVTMGLGQLPARPEYGAEPQSAKPPIQPDSVANDIDVIVLQRALTQDEIDGIKAGKNRMSFFGYIKYTDVFWLFGSRTTGFCFTYTAQPTSVSPFVTCPESDYTYLGWRLWRFWGRSV